MKLRAAAISAVALGVALAGCSVSPASSTTNARTNAGSNGGTSGGEGTAVTFDVTVNFSGVDPLQGRFTDSQTGSGFSSCSQYATLVGPTRPFYSPSPPMQQALIQGKSVSFLFTVASASYHGPGTYPAAGL